MLWESAGAFFPGENSLVSARKSHSSGVRGLVVRCLFFNTEGSCSNPCVFANFFNKYSDAGFHFFDTMRLPPFFGFVRFFKRNNCRLKIRFYQAQHAISDFCFFYRPVFFLCDFFKNLFSSKPPQFLQETKRFASVKNSSRFSALCDLPETFIEKIFQKIPKIFPLNFLFF